MWAIFRSVSLTSLAFVLLVLSCMILMIPSTVKSGYAILLVLGVADMCNAVSSPAASNNVKIYCNIITLD